MAITGFIGAGFPRPVYFTHTGVQNSASISVPSSVRAGDLLLLTDFAFQPGTSGPPASVIPSGFETINTLVNETNQARYNFLVKRAVGSEAGGSLTGMLGTGAGNRTTKLLTVLRGGKPVSTISIKSAGGQITSGDPAAQTKSSGSGTPALIVVASFLVTGSTPAVTVRSLTVGGNSVKVWENNYTETLDDIWHAGMFYKKVDTPADVVVDMADDGGLNVLQSCYIELT